MYITDEEQHAFVAETYMASSRMEQVSYFPMSAYGAVPGSYTDPLLYNSKTTSPFRWHSYGNTFDIAGHWYLEYDDIQRLKEWQPKDPNDPREIFPRPPQTRLRFEETIDEHGNRVFKYRYRYEFIDPWMYVPERYPFTFMYTGDNNRKDLVEGYGFKQGELLRASPEEEEVIRRIMMEEDREWEMIRRTEIIQEPWYYPGKVRPQDVKGSLDRAKARFRQAKKEGRPTAPDKDPDYDLAQSSEIVEPRDGPRAEWRHLWKQNLKDGKLDYQTTMNDGCTPEDNENTPPTHPGDFTKMPKTGPHGSTPTEHKGK